MYEVPAADAAAAAFNFTTPEALEPLVGDVQESVGPALPTTILRVATDDSRPLESVTFATKT